MMSLQLSDFFCVIFYIGILGVTITTMHTRVIFLLQLLVFTSFVV